MLDNNTAQQGLLIDLDGVIYQGGQLIDGAVEALDWIKSQQIPHLFVTNTTSRPRSVLLEKFQTLGFSARLDEVMTPVVAANQWLADHQMHRVALFVPSANQWLADHQMHRVALFVPSATQQDFDDLEPVALDRDGAVDAVIVGDLGEVWDFQLLNRAFQFLMQDPQPRLIALGMTRYWRGKNGLQLDVAPFIKALEHAASCEAVVVGKPAEAFFAASLAILGTSAEQALMIGDDIVGDVDAAQRCGIRGIQVKTGKFRDSDLGSGVEPYAVIDSFADLPNWWQSSLARQE